MGKRHVWQCATCGNGILLRSGNGSLGNWTEHSPFAFCLVLVFACVFVHQLQNDEKGLGMNFEQFVTAILAGGVVSTIIALIANRKSTSAGAYKDMALSITNLSKEVRDLRTENRENKRRFEEERAKDKVEFEVRIAKMERDHAAEMSELKNRMRELERERNDLLVELSRLRGQRN